MLSKYFYYYVLLMTLLLCIIIAFSHAGVHNIPPVVKVIYFQPTDNDNPDIEYYRKIVQDVQQHYQSEMIRHGFDSKTFKLDRTNIGKVNITVIKGTKRLHEYDELVDLEKEFENNKLLIGDKDNRQIIFLGGATRFGRDNAPAFWDAQCIEQPKENWQCIHRCVISTQWNIVANYTAHELGHAFWLQHNHDAKYLMHSFFDDPGFATPLKPIAHFEAKLLDKEDYFVKMPVEIDAVIDPLTTIPIVWGALKQQ